MKDEEINKKIKQGAVLVQVAFEVIGNPKEFVEKKLKEHLALIKKDEQLAILNEDIGEAEQIEGGLWSTYADVEILVISLDKLVWLCVNFTPASVEIIAPEELRMKDKDLTLWMNDLLARLHEISMSVRQTTTQNDMMVKNMNALIQNSILLAAEEHHSPKEIGEKVGINEEQLKPFFEALINQGKLEKKKDSYYRKDVNKKDESKKSVSKDGAKKRD